MFVIPVCIVFLSFRPQARQQAQMRQQMAADSKNDYSSYLQKFNQEQNEHYFTIIPNVFQVNKPSADFVFLSLLHRLVEAPVTQLLLYTSYLPFAIINGAFKRSQR